MIRFKSTQGGWWREPWAAAAIGFVLATGYALLARGATGDEEVGHFLLARYALVQPELFLSPYGRPLVTLGFSLPAQTGLLGARFLAAVLVGGTILAAARLAVRARLSPLWAVVFLVLQPFYLAHSATVMTEPWAAFLVAWGVVAHVEKKPRLLVVISSLLPVVRQEWVVFWPLVVWTVIREKRGPFLLLLPVPMLLWGLLGALWSHNPLWILNQVAWREYPSREVLHYVRSFVWIVGPGLFVPILIGVARAFTVLWDRPQFLGLSESTGYARRTLILAALLVLIMIPVYTVLAVWHPITGGTLRFFAALAMPLALLALFGVREFQRNARAVVWTALVIGVLGAVTLWAHPLHRDSLILAKRDLLPLAVALASITFYLLPRGRKRFVWLVAGVGLIALPRSYQGTLHLRPLPEHVAVAKAARSLESSGPSGRIFSASPLLAYSMSQNFHDQDLFPPVSASGLPKGQPGDVLFWDSHYMAPLGISYRSLLDDDRWSYAGGWVSSTARMAGAFFRWGSDPKQQVLFPGSLPEAVWRRPAARAQAGVPASLELTRVDPKNPGHRRVLAQRLYDAGEFTEAAEALATAESLAPGHPDVIPLRILILWRVGRVDQAIQVARAALAEDPESGNLHYLLGRALLDAKPVQRHLQRERLQEAEAHLLIGARKLPERWDVQYTTARFLAAQRRWLDADRFFRTALALDPDHTDTALFAAEVALKLRDSGRTETILRELLTRHPEEVRAWLGLGDLLHSQGRTSEARDVWQEGLEAAGPDPELQRRLRPGRPERKTGP